MRPSFKELVNQWEKMLEDSVEYLDLNPRTVQNQTYFASLHTLDSPTSTYFSFSLSINEHCYFLLLFSNETGSGNDATDGGETNALKTDVVNYLEKPFSDTVTKSDKIDKLHTFWQEPIASFPDEPIKLYVNDQPPSLQANHYESPIKLRSTSTTSDSENDQVTPTNERPQSYIDMEGKRCLSETEDLLVFPRTNGSDDQEERN